MSEITTNRRKAGIGCGGFALGMAAVNALWMLGDQPAGWSGVTVLVIGGGLCLLECWKPTVGDEVIVLWEGEVLEINRAPVRFVADDSARGGCFWQIFAEGKWWPASVPDERYAARRLATRLRALEAAAGEYRAAENAYASARENLESWDPIRRQCWLRYEAANAALAALLPTPTQPMTAPARDPVRERELRWADRPMPALIKSSMLDRCLYAATLLHVQGLLTDKERERVHQRMLKARYQR